MFNYTRCIIESMISGLIVMSVALSIPSIFKASANQSEALVLHALFRMMTLAQIPVQRQVGIRGVSLEMGRVDPKRWVEYLPG